MFSTATHLNSTFLSGDCFFTPLKQAMLQCSSKNFRELKYPTQCQLKSTKINRSYMLTLLFPDSVVIKKIKKLLICKKMNGMWMSLFFNCGYVVLKMQNKFPLCFKTKETQHEDGGISWVEIMSSHDLRDLEPSNELFNALKYLNVGYFYQKLCRDWCSVYIIMYIVLVSRV